MDWTEKEIQILKEKYPTNNTGQLSSVLNRSKDAIRCKAKNLKIKKVRGRGAKWSEDEIQILKKYYQNHPIDEFKKHLPNRGTVAIKIKANQIKLKKKPKWSKIEIGILKEKYPDASQKKLEQLLPNKTKKQIKSKARYLRLHKKYTNLWTDEEDRILIKNYSFQSTDEVKKLLPNRTKVAITTRAGNFNLHKTNKTISKTLSKKLKGINRGRVRLDLVEYNKTHILSGEKNPFYGKKHTKETKKKLSEKLKINSAFHRLNKDENFQLKRMKAMGMRPTKPEKIVISIIDKYSLPFEYTGDGKKIIGTLNPDFIHNGDKKICIEVFGDYWHTMNTIENRTEDGRKKYLLKFGYKTVVLWEHELKSDTAEELVLNKIWGAI